LVPDPSLVLVPSGRAFASTWHFPLTPYVEVWQTSNLRRPRLGEENKERRRRKNKSQHENIIFCPIP